MDQKTGESKLYGVSIRSWNATTIIFCGTFTVCYLAIVDRDPAWIMNLLSVALGFLFGKAAGASGAADSADSSERSAEDSAISASESAESAEESEKSANRSNN